MRLLALVVGALLSLWMTPSDIAANEIDVMLPGNNVSSKPILEFRARKPTLGGDGRTATLVGHAYVLLGREIDNGNTFFNSVKGFYPDGKGGALLVNTIYGKGVLKQTLDDAASEIVFRVYITPVQEAEILTLFRKWDDKKYSLWLQNCVDFTKEVARTVKLKLPPYPGTVTPEFPATFIYGLSQQNERDAPLRVSLPVAGAGTVSPPAPGTAPSRDPTELGRNTLEQTQRALPPQVTMPIGPQLPATPIPTMPTPALPPRVIIPAPPPMPPLR